MIISSHKFILDNIFKRRGEIKLGESVEIVEKGFSDIESISKRVKNFNGKFVLLGISEDIGVRANYGIEGARGGYLNFLKYFINTQSNSYQKSNNILVLGEVDVEDLMVKSDKTEDIDELRNLCSRVDIRVSKVVEIIVMNDKIPIIIGGGHNNSYPIIKGVSSAKKEKLNVINIDSHCDFRELEGRHSGNGFSYAYEEGFLEKYYVYGMQPYYNNQYMISRFQADKKLGYFTLDDQFKKRNDILNAVSFTGDKFGLEIDLDSIQDFPSSAISPLGFTCKEILYYVNRLLKYNILYFHFAESSPKKGMEYVNGKFISSLVCNLIFDN